MPYFDDNNLDLRGRAQRESRVRPYGDDYARRGMRDDRNMRGARDYRDDRGGRAARDYMDDRGYDSARGRRDDRAYRDDRDYRARRDERGMRDYPDDRRDLNYRDDRGGRDYRNMRDPRDARYPRDRRLDDRMRDARRDRPLTSQESQDLTQMSRDAYEAARAERDPYAARARGRTTNRELIDARGSIDSRAFNEKSEIVGYSIDKRDKPEPLVDSMDQGTRWSSQGRQGFGAQEAPPGDGRQRARRRQDLDSLSDTISGHAQYGRQRTPGIPKAAILLAILIVILLIVLIVILVV